MQHQLDILLRLFKVSFGLISFVYTNQLVNLQVTK